jgi:hypothetical protein
MTKGYSSNSKIFARRGDPWVSGREGREKFGRNLETENPDLDQFTRARKAEPKPKYVEPPKPAKAEASFSRRKANILAAMHGSIRVETHRSHEVKAAERSFKTCTGCRKAACVAKGLCQKPGR